MAHYNGGGMTQTTATLTPTRLKNIEESFLEHSIVPPKPFQHQHMAGFVTPTVNVSFNIKPTLTIVANPNYPQSQEIHHTQSINSSSNHLHRQSQDINNERREFYSNSNDSGPYSDDCSSEANSSVPEDYSFGHFSMNLSKSSKKATNTSANGGRNSKKSTNASKKAQNSSSSLTQNSESSQVQPAKSSKSRGGRKPAKSSKLTPEEEQKRAKRRERNKQAAARCRKRRLDQTNQLLAETQECESENKSLIDQLSSHLNMLSKLQNALEIHENHYCKRKAQFLQNTLALLDFDRINEAMKIIPTEEGEEDDDLGSMMNDDDNSTSDLTIQQPTRANSYSNNSNSTLVSQQFNNNNNNNTSIDFSVDPDTPNSCGGKRKRPNSLSITRTFKNESNQCLNFSNLSQSNQLGTTASGMSITTTTTAASANTNNSLQTPSSGIFFDNCYPDLGTGLTPLVPTMTSSILTPSTMEAFVKSLGSPMGDDQKRLILI